MGNNVGFQVEQGSVKIALLCTTKQDIEFMQKFQSENLKTQANLKGNKGKAYFFKYTIQRFLQLNGKPNILKLRQHFSTELSKPTIEIYMNRETSLYLESRIDLRNVLQELLQANFTPRYRQNKASSVISLDTLNYFADSKQFYRFKEYVPASQLHLISTELNFERDYLPLHDYPYLLGSLRKGALFFKVDSIDKIEKVAGSLIGQLTICHILQKMANCNEEEIEQLVQRAFKFGNNRASDLLVGDIYGGGAHDLGIDSNIIASSMGKISVQKETSTLEDRCKSLLLAFSINVAQFLCLQMKILKLNHCVLLANKFHSPSFYFAVQSLVHFFDSGAEILFAELGNFVSCMGNLDFKQISA